MLRTNINPKYSSYTVKKRIDSIANNLIANEENLGLVIGTYQKKQSSIYAYGNKNQYTNMDENSIFAIGSITKPIIISLMLILENEGLLSLNETIGNILPSTINYEDSRVKDIKLFDLAIHTSGLPREPVSIQSLYTGLRYLFNGANIYDHIDQKFMYDYLSNVQINKIKGKAYYSNLGIGLLGHLIELKMNQSLDDLLVKYIFTPLKMYDTSFVLSNTQLKIVSQGHVGDFPMFMRKNQPLNNWQFSNVMKSTGGLYSKANDLLNFLQAHLGESDTKLDQVFKKSHNILAKDDKLFYTYGWQVEYIKEYDINLYYKYGVIAGFSCYMGMELDSKTAIVVLKNNFNWTDKIGHQMLIEMAQSDFTLNTR